ncbi:RlpA-like double-psi beta-barrel-protein domain-containing protein-containing protein [Protomyces lactucae-debilis]|uniref:RlpA-like double-psi beta-barrel-protein domain-containing protein-containing protein n=1 Tax=Protomyces lactucae-debilis TaxID=2754530 RepID=A0A1Y2FA69_PROLT|nr:RlpA-like double-psi beta-barrel-protein domain-containing protein-containing protein [Protomyces lactucae-debilis]ORY80820.1 RlpA-like double-psi beta-barrel-protein domain-containing protein-containing protein [Protomyces lactucae-debilis]
MLTLFPSICTLVCIASVCLPSSAQRAPGLLPIGTQVTAHATFYTGNSNGACGADYLPPAGFLGTAISSTLWSDSAACGSCYTVTYGTSTKRIFVTDLCPECTWTSAGGAGSSLHQDLWQSAWTTLAAGKNTPSSAGILRGLTWTAVSCEFPSISIHWKDGSNDYWTAVAPRNHNVPVTKLEVRRTDTAGGVWMTLTLNEPMAHYANPAGDLPGTLFDMRLTGLTGKVLTLTGVRRGDNTQTFNVNF